MKSLLKYDTNCKLELIVRASIQKGSRKLFCLLVELNSKFFLILLKMFSESMERVAVLKSWCSVKFCKALFNCHVHY